MLTPPSAPLRAGQLLFHLQHTFEESYKSRPPYYCAYTNAMRGCSYIPAPVNGPQTGASSSCLIVNPQSIESCHGVVVSFLKTGASVGCFRLRTVFGSCHDLGWLLGPQEVLKFFLAGIEYHHIHHLNTRVP